MKNKIIYDFKNKIKLNIKGRNINRFIVRLYKNRIEILKCKNISKDEIDVVIYEKDYKKLDDIKTIYNIEKINSYGFVKVKRKLNLNKYLIISLFFGYVVIRVLTNIIFNVEIIHSDKEVIEFLKEELRHYGIKERTFKKNYRQLDKIKNDIREKYKDKIEWLEIEVKGTKYVVRAEMRVIRDKPEEILNRNIIAKKDAIILNVKAEHGQIIKEVNSYVKKGDVIISGNIYDNENIKDQVSAQGEVFGETWYELSVTYPFVYKEIKELNNFKNVFVIKFFGKTIELFNKNKFRDKKVLETVLLMNNIIPISFVKQEQQEVEDIEEILTTDEAIKKALDKAIEKVSSNLGENEYIIDHKIISTNIREDELELNVFFSVYENITDYQVIDENIQ